MVISGLLLLCGVKYARSTSHSKQKYNGEYVDTLPLPVFLLPKRLSRAKQRFIDYHEAAFLLLHRLSVPHSTRKFCLTQHVCNLNHSCTPSSLPPSLPPSPFPIITVQSKTETEMDKRNGCSTHSLTEDDMKDYNGRGSRLNGERSGLPSYKQLTYVHGYIICCTLMLQLVCTIRLSVEQK